MACHISHFYPLPDFGSGWTVVSSICSCEGNAAVHLPKFIRAIARKLLSTTPLFSQIFSLLLSPFSFFPLLNADKDGIIIIHGRTSFLLAFPFLLVNRIFIGKKVFYHPHTFLNSSFIPLLDFLFSGIFVFSAYNSEVIKKRFPKSKTIVMYNPLPLSLSRVKKTKARKKYDFLFVGRDVYCKRLDLFLSSLDKLSEKAKFKSALVIVDVSEKSLAMAGHQKKRGNLDVFLSLPAREVYDIYDQSRILVFPSTTDDGFGLVVLEAAFFGLEVLAEDNPKNREHFGDEIHYFSSEKDLTVKMEKLLKEGRCREYTFLRKYSAEQISKSYLKLCGD